MKTKCEVVGWVHLDTDQEQLMVREQDGHISLQSANPESTFEHRAIQTGVFHRGNPIFDTTTNEIIGYEMEAELSLEQYSSI